MGDIAPGGLDVFGPRAVVEQPDLIVRPRPVAPAPARHAPQQADDAQVDRPRKHIVSEHEVSAISPLTWHGPGIGQLALFVRVRQAQAAGAGRRHKEAA